MYYEHIKYVHSATQQYPSGMPELWPEIKLEDYDDNGSPQSANDTKEILNIGVVTNVVTEPIIANLPCIDSFFDQDDSVDNIAYADDSDHEFVSPAVRPKKAAPILKATKNVAYPSTLKRICEVSLN